MSTRTAGWIQGAMLVACVTLTSTGAAADVVGPPPMSCPPGSTPSSSHSGPVCFPTNACTTDADCAAGTCMEVFQCIAMLPCGGLPRPDGGPCEISNILGACGPEDECAMGECFSRHICSEVPVAPRAMPGGGCACTVGRASVPDASGLVLFAGALAIARVRRRRSR